MVFLWVVLNEIDRFLDTLLKNLKKLEKCNEQQAIEAMSVLWWGIKNRR